LHEKKLIFVNIIEIFYDVGVCIKIRYEFGRGWFIYDLYDNC